MTLSQDLARDLLEMKAVQINPNEYFTWTSGIKSPIYCDNRLTMSYPTIRRKIVEAFVQKIKEMDEQPEVIAGCATAGIPHAAWLAERLDLPMVYVRSKPKGHGKGNQIEGEIKEGQKVLVIEDLISTGGSSIESAKALEKEGAKILDVFAIFSYGLKKATQQFEAANLSFSTITNFDELIDALVEDDKLNNQQKKELLEWRDNL
ncbi:orotate phosphoribosyltransferase [Oceanobacillus caeni]|uniref:Orotate phosphoribosyltransferase n=1 Tax=Oceanobacillus caeni TaxID=405946 RepID=A0ABR5MLV0_9BACI|nr:MULTISPECIES: orotate phosphoribosyltransferase [Bacillaceae]KKE78037.1 orotate phosphoribosyltransferase [Bacilli bacterium VT-13-104]PZD85693.1 orotate phosphoribosyltransferase [Bacilli bacterium]KPH77158.1 orotate phosphoribosyltransferase [Oceanobacillus caeni]MBU8790152.1 orotate phosphoribosyltransferase [Oceanobacillus caeni]MCR1835596.1 orotate phosphoribosyltransferase [Oceanobacillus caeni]